MPRERVFWMLLVSFVVAGLALSIGSNRTRVIEQAFLSGNQPSPQRVERAWRQVSLVPEKVIGISPVMRLADPQMVHATKDHLFVLDWGDKAIKKFNRDGDFLQIYRAWSGESSASALEPTHFAVGQGGEVWVCYQRDNLVKMFSEGGRTLHTFRVSLPHRIMPMPGNGFVVMGGEPGADLFQRYDMTGRLAGAFGRIVAGEVQHPLVLDGYVIGSGSLIYASRYAGLLASYSSTGDLKYLVQTIDPSPLPRIWISPSGRWKVEPGSPLKSLSLSISDGKIYVMSERESKMARNRIIDIYSEANGSYLYSIRLPQPSRQSVVLGDNIYTIDKKRVIRWKIKTPKA